MVLYLCRMCQCGLQRCFGRSSVYFYAPRCRKSQYRRSHSPLRVSVERSCSPCILTLYSAGFKAGSMLFLFSKTARSLFVFYRFPFFFGWYCIIGLLGLIGCKSLFPSLALTTSFNNTNYNFFLSKKVGCARLRESDMHPISPKTTAPQNKPIDRKNRKGKRVEDCSRDRAA